MIQSPTYTVVCTKQSQPKSMWFNWFLFRGSFQKQDQLKYIHVFSLRITNVPHRSILFAGSEHASYKNDVLDGCHTVSYKWIGWDGNEKIHWSSFDNICVNHLFLSDPPCLGLPEAVWEYLSGLQFQRRAKHKKPMKCKNSNRSAAPQVPSECIRIQRGCSLSVFDRSDFSLFKRFSSVINHSAEACKWSDYLSFWNERREKVINLALMCVEKSDPGGEGQKRHVTKLTRSGWWYANWSLTSASYRASRQEDAKLDFFIKTTICKKKMAKKIFQFVKPDRDDHDGQW